MRFDLVLLGSLRFGVRYLGCVNDTSRADADKHLLHVHLVTIEIGIVWRCTIKRVQRAA
jgi:hypothetical protein